MSINGTTEFVTIFKKIVDEHIKLYKGTSTIFNGWDTTDFDTTALIDELNKTDNILLYGIIKKAYDTIKSYQRAHKIHNQTRGDYYRYAIDDRAKDKLTIDVIMNNLNTIYDKLQRELSEKKVNVQ